MLGSNGLFAHYTDDQFIAFDHLKGGILILVNNLGDKLASRPDSVSIVQSLMVYKDCWLYRKSGARESWVLHFKIFVL